MSLWYKLAHFFASFVGPAGIEPAIWRITALFLYGYIITFLITEEPTCCQVGLVLIIKLYPVVNWSRGLADCNDLFPWY